MLPFGLKVIWFIFSLSGLLSCWIFLWSFGRLVRTKWGPVLYCIGSTLTHGMFCLGMIYRMNPLLMPRSFCLAQSILMSVGTFIETGVILALSLATGVTVQKPKTWGDAQRALQWRKVFAIPIAIIPIVSTAAYVGLSISFGFISPTDEMCCDSMSLEWVRLFGSSGIPFFLSIPIFYQSIHSFVRIRKTNLHLLRSLPDASLCTGPAVGPSEMGSGALRKTMNRFTLRDAAMMPVNLALTISSKSSMLSMRVLKGEKTTLDGSGTRVDRKDFQRQQDRISRSPPLPLPLTSLRAKVNGGSRSVSPNSSVTGGPTEIAQSGSNRSSLRDTERWLSRTSSHFSFRGGELDVDEQNSDVSSSFPTFANDGDKPVDPEKGVAATIDDLQEGGGEVQAQPVCRAQADVFQTGVVDIMPRPSSSRTDHDEETSMHRIELLTNESGTRTLFEEVREKIDLKSMLEVGGGIQDKRGCPDFSGTVEDGLDEEADHLQTHSLSPKNTPTSMVFSINGPFKKPRRQPASLSPAIWRVILFQFAFVFIQFLSFMTTFVDLVSGRRTPSPFGTQHVALLLAAWCPVFIFGSLPAVRRNLAPWRPIL